MEILSNLDPRLIAILAGTILLGFLLLRFGRAIARFLLIVAALAIVGLIAVAIVNQAQANRVTAEAAIQAAQATHAATVGHSMATLVTGGLLALIIALAGAGYCYYRWRRSEQHMSSPHQTRATLPTGQQSNHLPPVIYIPQPPPRIDDCDLSGIDTSEWGW
jgi:hypothetical protein